MPLIFNHSNTGINCVSFCHGHFQSEGSFSDYPYRRNTRREKQTTWAFYFGRSWMALSKPMTRPWRCGEVTITDEIYILAWRDALCALWFSPFDHIETVAQKEKPQPIQALALHARGFPNRSLNLSAVFTLNLPDVGIVLFSLTLTHFPLEILVVTLSQHSAAEVPDEASNEYRLFLYWEFYHDTFTWCLFHRNFDVG